MSCIGCLAVRILPVMPFIPADLDNADYSDFYNHVLAFAPRVSMGRPFLEQFSDVQVSVLATGRARFRLTTEHFAVGNR